MIIMDKMEQGSAEWLQARIGCVTMSNAALVLSKGRGSKPSETRRTYLLKVASEILTGQPEEFKLSWAMERGNILEPFARAAYSHIAGVDVTEVGLAYLDDTKRISASPDGLTLKGGVEIKCPGAKQHVKTIVDDINDPKYTGQIQGCMWIFEKESWDFVSFCPEVDTKPIYIKTIYRDEEVIKRLEEESFKAVEEIDSYVAMAKMQISGELLGICNGAIELIDEIRNPEPEIF